MRWYARADPPAPAEPTLGECRTDRRFLWRPRCLLNGPDGRDQWRWLEFSKVRRRYEDEVDEGLYPGWRALYWDDAG